MDLRYVLSDDPHVRSVSLTADQRVADLVLLIQKQLELDLKPLAEAFVLYRTQRGGDHHAPWLRANDDDLLALCRGDQAVEPQFLVEKARLEPSRLLGEVFSAFDVSLLNREAVHVLVKLPARAGAGSDRVLPDEEGVWTREGTKRASLFMAIAAFSLAAAFVTQVQRLWLDELRDADPRVVPLNTVFFGAVIWLGVFAALSAAFAVVFAIVLCFLAKRSALHDHCKFALLASVITTPVFFTCAFFTLALSVSIDFALSDGDNAALIDPNAVAESFSVFTIIFGVMGIAARILLILGKWGDSTRVMDDFASALAVLSVMSSCFVQLARPISTALLLYSTASLACVLVSWYLSRDS